ncbi:protein FAM185A-like [Diadema antillarum]|uniref:protein FAM185A-like n=1 Tax=Diadema antillarum TaxID=105358 RepID=UPI003A838912
MFFIVSECLLRSNTSFPRATARCLSSNLPSFVRERLKKAPAVPGAVKLRSRLQSTATGTGSESDSGSNFNGKRSPLQSVTKVKSWPFELSTPFGKLMIKQTWFPTRIVPTNPHDYPAADRVFVHLLSSSDTSLGGGATSGSEEIAQLDSKILEDVINSVQCSLDEQGIHLTHKKLADVSSLAFIIEVPTCYDIQVSSSGSGHISVENLENEECSIDSEDGNVTLKSMKAAHVNIRSRSGDIMCVKALQGSGVIATGHQGKVTTDRLQGLDFEITTDAGAVHIKDIYSRTATVTSANGPITIQNMHTVCKIASTADVNVGCVEGVLSATLSESGSFKGYLSRHDSAEIQTDKGNIEIRVPEECRSHVHLEAKEVDIDSALVFRSTKPSDSHATIGELNGGGEEAKITAQTQEGSITVKTQSWFDSLGLAR